MAAGNRELVNLFKTYNDLCSILMSYSLNAIKQLTHFIASQWDVVYFIFTGLFCLTNRNVLILWASSVWSESLMGLVHLVQQLC